MSAEIYRPKPIHFELIDLNKKRTINKLKNKVSVTPFVGDVSVIFSDRFSKIAFFNNGTPNNVVFRLPFVLLSNANYTPGEGDSVDVTVDGLPDGCTFSYNDGLLTFGYDGNSFGDVIEFNVVVTINIKYVLNGRAVLIKLYYLLGNR